MKLLERAVGVAMSGPPRQYLLGAVGLRADGTLVTSINGGGASGITPSAHAEARLVRKLDAGSVVFVARVLKNGTVAMAKPCVRCQKTLRARKVKTVFYTIAEKEYGRIDF